MCGRDRNDVTNRSRPWDRVLRLILYEHILRVRAIPTYRVDRLYDAGQCIELEYGMHNVL